MYKRQTFNKSSLNLSIVRLITIKAYASCLSSVVDGVGGVNSRERKEIFLNPKMEWNDMK